jgi:hypothetical protein
MSAASVVALAREPDTLPEQLANIAQALYTLTAGARSEPLTRVHVQAIKLATLVDELRQADAAYTTALELIREQDAELHGLRQENDDLREFADELTSLGLHIHVDHERREFRLLRRFERPVLTTDDWQLLTTAVRELQKLEKTLTRGAAGAARGD